MQRIYIQINDPHLSDQPPRGRTASYLDDVLAKMAWAIERANDLHASGIVITGDLFHRKNAAHTTHRTVQRIREVLARADTRVHIVPGNHDEAHGGGLAGQPLLSVVDGVHVVLLDGPSDFDSYIAGVPWANAFERTEGAIATVNGQPYLRGAELLAKRVADTRRPLVFAHAPISDRPFPFGPEAQGWMLDMDVATAIQRRAPAVRLLAHGHMHRQQMVHTVETSIGEPEITFSNPGALSRATVAVDDVERTPAIAVIDTEWGAAGPTALYVTYEDVPCRPAADVLRLEEHARDAARDGTVEALAASLSAADAEVVDAQVLREVLARLQRPDGVDEATWTLGLRMAAAAIDGEVL